MTTVSPEVDKLWQDFHSVVNMTSRELRDWLFAEAAQEAAESLPEALAAEAPMGAQVLHILAKRKTDLTGKDLQAMQEVVDFVRDVRGEEIEGPASYDDALRHQLMDAGHDPLKPVDAGRSTGADH
jgi:hypothetical protein